MHRLIRQLAVATLLLTASLTADAFPPGASAKSGAGSVVSPRHVPHRHFITLRMLTTAYCPCSRCCGRNAKGVTASGARAVGCLVAADPRVLPMGTRLIVPGYAGNCPVRVRDTGSGIHGNRLDLLFSSHQVARQWGVRWVTVTILSKGR